LTKPLRHLALTFTLFTLSNAIQAQDVSARFIDDIPVHYIYASVLGTGFYDLSGKKIVVARLPFASKKFNAPPAGSQWRFIFPLAVGYENMGEDNDFEMWLPSELLSVSMVPGLEYFYQPRPNWLLKPFIQVGLGRDYVQHETTSIAIGGLRSIGNLYDGELWDIAVGNSLQWAGEELQHKEQYTSFSLFEFGMNFKRKLPVRVLNRQLNMSFYTVWQYFYNQQNARYPLVKPVDLENLYQLGFSLGLQRPYSILGVNVDTVSIGLSRGEEGYAISFGTGFPF